ncbi:hypothetical protein ACFLVS_01790 [Chloroflexota bacterium]
MCFVNCGISVYKEKGMVVKVTGIEEHPSYSLCQG